MKIRTVKFRCNVEVGSYQHEHVELEAELGKGESAAKAIRALAKEAYRILGVSESAQNPHKRGVKCVKVCEC